MTSLPPAVRAALAVSRPLFWLNSASLCVVAQILGDRPLSAAVLLVIVFATWPLNLFVYAVNDLHDHASDLRNPRKGSAEGALAEPGVLGRLFRLSLGVNAAFAAVFLATGTLAASLALVAIYGVGWAYSAPPLRLKSRPGWDSLANAGYALPLVFACQYLGVATPWREVVALAIWAVGSHAFTSIQDVAADRAAGLRTIATALGERRAALLALAAYMLTGLVVAVAHPAAASLLLGHVAIVLAYLASTAADAAHLAYRRFMAWNVACGFVVVTAIALAHPRQTFTAAVLMLALCAVVAAAVLLGRVSRSMEPAGSSTAADARF